VNTGENFGIEEVIKMKTVLNGQLEIDHDRGVIYFHLTDKAEVTL